MSPRDQADLHQLNLQLRTISPDDIIAPVIHIPITSRLTTRALSLLADIFTLRADLAFQTGDILQPIFDNLQLHRLTQIARVLRLKYPLAPTPAEKTRIHNLLHTITTLLPPP